MFKLFKSYMKWKLLSKLKDKVISYEVEKYNYVRKQNQWKCKTHEQGCVSKKRFDEIQKEQIKYSSEQHIITYYKLQEVKDLIKLVEGL